MTKRQGKQLVIYSRKSRFTGKGESIENQIEMCRQYIAVHFGVKEAENACIYEDEGFSGGSLDRPQFKKMMEDAKSKQFTAIVVYRLDRISRNIGDFAKLIEHLNSMRIDFISIKEQFDTGSPMGRAMMYISSVFSQLERETIAERIRDNMHELAKSGRWLGGTTPTGYSSVSTSTVTIDGKTKRACKLKILPEEMRLVELIFDKFLETGSLTQVDAFLLERRCRTKCGNRFTRFSIKNILTNPVYMIADKDACQYLTAHGVDLFAEPQEFDGIHGIMAYNRTLQQPGKARVEKPMEEWIVAVGQHEGAISGKKWIQVQDLLERNASRSFRRTGTNAALLSGILRCSACGDYMRPKQSNREMPNGERVYSYLCSTKERSKCTCCQMNNPNGNLLDRAVVTEIKKLCSDRPTFAFCLEQNKKALSDDRNAEEAELEKLHAERKEQETEIQNLVEKLARIAGTTAEDYILQRIEALHSANAQLRVRIAQVETSQKAHERTEAELDVLCQRLSSFSESMENLSLAQKRAAIGSLVRSVIWDGENAHIHLLGSDGGTSVWKEPMCEDSK